MIEAYTALHKAGYAHSVEVWHEDELVGGLYGVAYGKIFCGGKHVAKKSNASKVAFIHWPGSFRQITLNGSIVNKTLRTYEALVLTLLKNPTTCKFFGRPALCIAIRPSAF
jgi:leucyl/phenylalanyl-tRNA--protein transferase